MEKSITTRLKCDFLGCEERLEYVDTPAEFAGWVLVGESRVLCPPHNETYRAMCLRHQEEKENFWKGIVT